MDALELLVTWMVSAEQLLSSEAFEVNELEVMEHQLSQYLVRPVPHYSLTVLYLLNLNLTMY